MDSKKTATSKVEQDREIVRRALALGEHKELADKVKRYTRAREAGKRSYARADRILDEIAKELKPGEEITLNAAGRKVVLVDNFAEKNTAFKSAYIHRYELKLIEA